MKLQHLEEPRLAFAHASMCAEARDRSVPGIRCKTIRKRVIVYWSALLETAWRSKRSASGSNAASADREKFEAIQTQPLSSFCGFQRDWVSMRSWYLTPSYIVSSQIPRGGAHRREDDAAASAEGRGALLREREVPSEHAKWTWSSASSRPAARVIAYDARTSPRNRWTRCTMSRAR